MAFNLHRFSKLLPQQNNRKKAGFTSCWIAEDYYFRGALAVVSAVAARTRTLRVRPGVINPYTRHPVLIAMEMQGISQLSAGRSFLGLGCSERFWMEEQLGIKWGAPATVLRESIEVIRRAWQAEEFSYTGNFLSISGVKLQFRLPHHIPIYLGTMRQRTLALAGKLADGVVLPLMAGPQYVRFAVSNIAQGAKEVGRDFRAVPIYTYVLLSVDENRDTARKKVRNILAHYLGFLANQRRTNSQTLLKDHPIFSQAGYTEESIKGFIEREQRSDPDEALANSIIDAFAVAGEPDECCEKLQRLADAGVTGFILFEIPGHLVTQLVSATAKHILTKF
ncbi:MAG: LLM class flavin-dependent oxidoreductase [Candidatus Acidiferrales bacterium]